METLAYILIFAGWISFLAFLFLPIYESEGLFGFGIGPFSTGLVNVLFTTFLFWGDAKAILIAGISILLNLSILLSPLIIYNDFTWFGKIYFIFASILSVVASIYCVSQEESSKFYRTFYLWSLSFILIAIGLNLL